MESNSPVPLTEDVGRQSSHSIRAARDVRDEPSKPELAEDFARLKAQREADADELASMLVRVADTERARDASEKRAGGLEAWTQELEEKVAAARTRAEEADDLVAIAKREAESTQNEVTTLRARVTALEADLARVRRESEDALEVERVKRGLEVDALAVQHGIALAGVRSDGGKDRIAKLSTLVEELAQADEQASAVRKTLLERARRIVETDPTTTPPPPLAPPPLLSPLTPLTPITPMTLSSSSSPEAVSGASPTMPPSAMPRNAKKRGRRPSAPPLPPRPMSPFAPPPLPAGAAGQAPVDKLETFEDLDFDE